MIDDNQFNDFLARSQACKAKMAALLDRYGAEFCEWALHQAYTEQAEKPQAGRNKDFDPDTLRNIWVFVQSQKSILGLSVNTVCKHASYEWTNIDRRGCVALKVVTGESLRRRYQEAVKYLRKESLNYRKLAAYRTDISPEASVSHTERWWRKLLAEEIRRCAEMGRN